MKITLSLVMILGALVVVPGVLTSYGDGGNVLSPRAQMAAGIAAEDVACREGLQLMIRDNGNAICISEQSAMRLADMGVAMTSGMSDNGARYALMKDAILSVNDALALYDQYGEDAFEKITALNVEDHAYPWVTNYDTGIEVADGSVMDRRGTVVWSGIDLEAATRGVSGILESGNGAWVTYVFLNPATGMDEAKMSWTVLRDGYIFGSGFYIEGQKAKMIASDWSIRKAISAYNQLGTEEAFAHITAMESNRESYPFVIGMDGMVAAHGSTPLHVGEQSAISMLDEWESILAELADAGKATASYEFNNPATDTVELKQTMLVLHDGYIFGSGFYNSAGMPGTPEPENATSLTDEEVSWLEDNDTIRVAYDPGWRPIEYLNDAGEIDGLTAWYMTKIEEYAGASLEKVNGISTWAGALDEGRNGNADVFLMIMDVEDRHDFLDFTRPHTILPTDMITLGTKDIDNSDLSGFKIASVKGYAIESWYDERHPGADYVSFDDVPSALQAVADGNADMYIESWVIVSDVIQRHGIEGLADSGPSGYSYEMSVGVQKDNAILKSIMQKAVDSIPEDEKMQFLDSLS